MVECAALEMRFTGNGNVGSNPTLSATHPQHSSLLSVAYRKAPEQAGLHAPNRNRRILPSVSSALMSGFCQRRLWRLLHRFGLPDEQGGTGKNVHLNVRTGGLDASAEDADH